MAEPTDPPSREADRLIYAGLLGLSAASVIQLIEKETLPIPHLISVYLFALAIPLLAVGLITDFARRAGTPIPAWHDLIGLAGASAAVLGLGALFFHFGLGVGLAFVVASLFGFVVIRRL
jgi:hypothetical protein